MKKLLKLSIFSTQIRCYICYRNHPLYLSKRSPLMQTPFGIYLWGLVSLRAATAVTIPALSTAGEALNVQISHRGSVLQLCYLCSSGFADKRNSSSVLLKPNSTESRPSVRAESTPKATQRIPARKRTRKPQKTALWTNVRATAATMPMTKQMRKPRTRMRTNPRASV